MWAEAVRTLKCPFCLKVYKQRLGLSYHISKAVCKRPSGPGTKPRKAKAVELPTLSKPTFTLDVVKASDWIARADATRNSHRIQPVAPISTVHAALQVNSQAFVGPVSLTRSVTASAGPSEGADCYMAIADGPQYFEYSEISCAQEAGVVSILHVHVRSTGIRAAPVTKLHIDHGPIRSLQWCPNILPEPQYSSSGALLGSLWCHSVCCGVSASSSENPISSAS